MAENMTDATAYEVLKSGTSNKSTLDAAIEYYYENHDKMVAGYPRIDEHIKNNVNVRLAVGKFADEKYSKYNDESDFNSLDSNAQNFLNEYASSIVGKSLKERYQREQQNKKEKAEEEKKEVLANIIPYLDDTLSSEDKFKLPDMGDFYLGNVDDTFFKMIDKSMRDKVDAQKACHYASTAPQKELGYNEKKDSYFLKCLVSYGEDDIKQGLIDGNHIVLSLNNISSSEEDTTDAMNKLKERVTSSNSQYPLLENDELAGNMFDMKIVGIAAPEMPHWCRESNVERSTISIKKISVSTIEGEKKKEFLYVPEPVDASRQLKGDTVWKYFAYICELWREIRVISGDPDNEFGEITFDWLLSPGDTDIVTSDGEAYNLQDSAMATARAMLKAIQNAGGIVYLNIDGSGLKEDSSKFPIASKGTWCVQTNQVELTRLARSSDGDIRLTGYNRVSMEASRRFLGELYVKVNNELSQEVYINLAKMIANDDNAPKGVAYDTTYEGNNKSCFDMGSYDVNSRSYADAFFETMSELDDRPTLHKELLGVDWKELQEYNVILGDLCFLVPPSNIRMETYTQSERVPLLRAKGTMAKTTPSGESHMRRRISMDIYFNEDRGINGMDYIHEVKTGVKLMYEMNGLRALVSMFKFTPFLPITNKYINKTLGIDAVCLNNINVQSVPNYPKLIQATITMTEFEWTVYMPDIAQMALEDSNSSLTLEEKLANDETVAYWNRTEEEKQAEKEQKQKQKDELKAQHIQNLINGVEDDYDESLEALNEVEQRTYIKDSFKNWFAATINWKTFRYYYQRPIIRGNIISNWGLDFNSEQYIAATCGAMTSLIPMRFQDPTVKFYMANENYLKQILQDRLNTMRGATEIKFTDDQIKLLEIFGEVNDALSELEQNTDFIDMMKKLNDKAASMTESGTYFRDVADVVQSEVGQLFGMNKGCIYNDLGFDIGLEDVNGVLASIDKKLEPVRLEYSDYIIQDMDYISYLDGNEGIVVYGIALKLRETNIGKDTLTGFYKNVSGYMGADVFNDKVKDYEFERVFADDNRLVIPLAIEVEKADKVFVPDSSYYTSGGESSTLTDHYAPRKYAQFELKGDAASMRFLAAAKEIAKQYKELNEKGGYSESVPDVNNLMNLKYDEYDIGEALVTNWNVSLSNTYADIKVLSSDGFAPQYLGGSDVHISLVIRTQDEETAKKIVAIPKEITRLTRTYHMVMPCVPLRVDSEFTKFFGVNEVTCEYCTISTVEGFPGLFDIRMELISMDRTLREREAAVRRSANNSGYNNTNPKIGLKDWKSGSASISDVANDLDKSTAVFYVAVGIFGAAAAAATFFSGGLALPVIGTVGTTILGATGVGAVAGAAGGVATETVYLGYKEATAEVDENASFGDGTEVSAKYAQYFELKKALAENDLYPDLELPTITEMKAIGLYFMRYKFQDERVYVDPDFYFVYPFTIQSQLYRELALNAMNCNLGETKLTDSSGAQVIITPSENHGFELGETNEVYENQKKISDERRKKVQYMKENQRKNSQENKKKKKAEPAVNMLSLVNATMERDSWKVCDKINGMFLEKRFYNEVQSYLSANNISNAAITTGRGTSSKENTDAANAKSEEEKKDPSVIDAGNDSKQEGQEQVQDGSGKVENVNYTEGQFIVTRLSKAQEAADSLLSFLKARNLFTTSSETGKLDFPLKYESDNQDALISDIKVAVNEFLNVDEVHQFLEALNVNIDDDFKSVAASIVVSAACSATADKEYSQKTSDDWKPNNRFVGRGLGISGKKEQSIYFVSNEDDEEKAKKVSLAVQTAFKFGVFGIKMYDKEAISAMLSDSTEEGSFGGSSIIEKNITSEDEYPWDDIRDRSENTRFFLFDPYYRKDHISLREIEEYKYACIMSTKYCTFAYMRLMVYWLYRLVKRWAIPTITADSLRDISAIEIEAEKEAKARTGVGETTTEGSDGTIVALAKYIEFFSKGVGQIDTAKIWTACVLASSDGDKKILKEIDERNYGALNALVQSCATASASLDPVKDAGPWAIRKMTLALVGQQVIKSMNALGVNQSLPGNAIARDELQRLYLRAAEDPSTYIPHSYHDMIVNDARGRMLRAFPTFYMCFIDEGREIGYWKLHDNFYNTSSIMSIEVVKSRKIPADICTIVMSNFYNSYTTENEDYVRTQVATFDQAWNSIFSPSDYFVEQETYRNQKPIEIKLRLRQGARIHVRMGYGNNAAMLPVLFNGVITEVDSQSTVNIIAQGDGWELLNPINIDKQAHDISHSEDFFYWEDNGDTPLQIATALFNTKGGVMKEFLEKHLGLNIGNRNPFGITHFGNPNFRSLVKCGEACQNLYESMTRPVFGGNIDVRDSGYDDLVAADFPIWSGSSDVPKITFDIFQKTPWDVLNICKSISPDFRCAVVPFGFRSTVFLGSPHYYYCYDYFKDTDGVIKEKRKPFQQWHLYTSEQDIIGNGIVATARDMYNVVTGMYKTCAFTMENQETVGPLYADWDIYPESQRSVIVDTSLLCQGVPCSPDAITNKFEDWFGEVALDDTGSITSHKKVAWRAAASALREGVMDMYAGDLILFGDPSVKPQDRFYMSDSYTGIMGQALVKEVVYRLSIDTGFTTSISPDCIACVNDEHEIVRTMVNHRVGAISNVFSSAISSMAGILGAKLSDEDLATYSKYAKRTAGAVAAGAVTNTAFRVYGKITGAADAAKKIAEAGTENMGLLKKFGSKLTTGMIKGVPILGWIATAVDVLIVPYVNSLLIGELKNYKVIKIFPLKKWGYPYTAGFEGSRGCVYGSPTWEDRGSLGDIFDWIEDNCPFLGYVNDFFFDDDLIKMTDSFKRKNGLINADGSAADMEVSYGKLQGKIAQDDFT